MQQSQNEEKNKDANKRRLGLEQKIGSQQGTSSLSPIHHHHFGSNSYHVLIKKKYHDFCC